MSDADIRRALRERLTIRAAFLVENGPDGTPASLPAGTVPRVGIEETPATLETMMWALQQLPQLKRVTHDEVGLLGRYAAAIDPELRESIERCVRALIANRPLAPAETRTEPDTRSIIRNAVANAEPKPAPRKRRQGLSRFNYLDNELFNREWQVHCDAASTQLRVQHARELLRGNETAFDAYLRADLRAIEAPFVTQRLQIWAHAGRFDLIDKAIATWRGGRGTSDPNLPSLIRRDQWIFVLSIQARRTHPGQVVVETLRRLAERGIYVERDTVMEVRKQYGRMFERWCSEHPNNPPSEIAFARAISGMWHTYRRRLRRAGVDRKPPS